MSRSPKRYRGVVLTQQGIDRLEAAISTAQDEEKYGKRFTQAELSERANLSIKTIKKIRDRIAPVDEVSVRSLFEAFGLTLETADYGLPELTSQLTDREPTSKEKRLTKIDWGEKPEMARLAAQDYPTLPGAIFSAEHCKAFALAQQMRGWFETLGYRFETHEVWEADYFEWIINVSVWRSRYIRILVRGVDGEVGLADVSALHQSVETHKVDEGWLVTTRRIARAARDEVAKSENEHLGCYTLDELLDQDANFSGYLTWLDQEIQKRGIDQKYVPLACVKEEVDPMTRQRIGMSRYGDLDGWIDGYIDLWLDDPAKEHISVLGEFGTGKTWFAFHYAWKALQRYRGDCRVATLRCN